MLYGTAAVAWHRGVTARLSDAAARGATPEIIAAVEAGADPNATDRFGRSVVVACADLQDGRAVSMLLDRGACPKPGRQLGSLVARLAGSGQEANLRRVLDMGGDPNSTGGDGMSALAQAARGRHASCVRLLLSRGATAGPPGSLHERTLAVAGASGVGVLRLLLDRGMKVDARTPVCGRTALMWASESGDDASVALLLNRGARVDARDSDGATALEWAARAGRASTVALLLRHQANRSEALTARSMSAAHWAGHPEVVATLRRTAPQAPGHLVPGPSARGAR